MTTKFPETPLLLGELPCSPLYRSALSSLGSELSSKMGRYDVKGVDVPLLWYFQGTRVDGGDDYFVVHRL